MLFHSVAQTATGNVLHHNPALVVCIEFDVVEADQVWVFEVQAVLDAANLYLEVTLDLLQRDFFSSIVNGKVDFPKATRTDSAFDRKAI